MKNVILLCLLFIVHSSVIGQKVSKMFVNLYTDSLKKGTYNYINVDGQLTNGRFIPLDSTKVKFQASEGTFSGNSLFIPLNSKADSVTIKITLREDPQQTRTIVLYTKKIQTVFEINPNEINKKTDTIKVPSKIPKSEKSKKGKN